MVKILLSAGADPNTSLKPNGLTAICEAIERGYDEVAKELFEAHATFSCGAVEMTPLHSSVHLDRVDLVKYFLAKGVSPDLKESFGIVPLEEANSADVVEALINAKANVNAKDDNGQTVLDAILQCCDLMIGTPAQRLQVSRSIDVQIAKSVALLVGAGAKVNEVSQYGHRPLEVAAARYSPRVLEPLVKAGADVNAISGEMENTPLMAAASSCRWDNIRFLIANHADIGIKNNAGSSAASRALESAKARQDLGRIESSDFGTVDDCKQAYLLSSPDLPAPADNRKVKPTKAHP